RTQPAAASPPRIVPPPDLACQPLARDGALSLAITGIFLAPVRLHQLERTSVCQLHFAKALQNHAFPLQALIRWMSCAAGDASPRATRSPLVPVQAPPLSICSRSSTGHLGRQFPY